MRLVSHEGTMDRQGMLLSLTPRLFSFGGDLELPLKSAGAGHCFRGEHGPRRARRFSFRWSREVDTARVLGPHSAGRTPCAVLGLQDGLQATSLAL